MARAESRALNAAARAMPELGNPDTVETRFRRFLANSRIDAAKSFLAKTRAASEH